METFPTLSLKKIKKPKSMSARILKVKIAQGWKSALYNVRSNRSS